MKSDIAKKSQRFLTQRGQQHRDHGLDVPSPSARNANQQSINLAVHIFRLFSPTNDRTQMVCINKHTEQVCISENCANQMCHVSLIENFSKLQELPILQKAK